MERSGGGGGREGEGKRGREGEGNRGREGRKGGEAHYACTGSTLCMYDWEGLPVHDLVLMLDTQGLPPSSTSPSLLLFLTPHLLFFFL